MKRLKETAFLVTTLLFVSFFSACDIYSYVPPSNVASYDNPTWAPAYTPGVRYYYLPDIESYYDLSAQEFVYLDNGQWNYSPNLPGIYSDYDLSNCFTVAVNYNTYQPWMHHQYYVSHYPMYYYRDYYDHSNIPYVRGFNENNRSAVYWSENERSHARNWDNNNQRTNHQFQYSAPDRQHQNNTYNSTAQPQTRDNNNARNQQNNDPGNRQHQNNTYNSTAQPQTRDNNNARNQQNNNPGNGQHQNNSFNSTAQPQTRDNRQQPNIGNNNPAPTVTPGGQNPGRQDGSNKTSTIIPPRISGFESGARQQNEITPVRPNQNTNYYGRTIGQPVRVEKQMRQPTSTTPRTNNDTKPNTDSRQPNDNSRK